jgi:ribosome-associated protein
MEALEITPDLTIPAEDLSVVASRAGGPGGQHVNKVATRVTLRFALSTSAALPAPVRERLADLAGNRLTADGDLVLTCQRRRSQYRNLEDCRERLRQLVLRALPPPTPRRETRPSRGAIEKRLTDKARQSRKKRERQAPDLRHDDL